MSHLTADADLSYCTPLAQSTRCNTMSHLTVAGSTLMNLTCDSPFPALDSRATYTRLVLPLGWRAVTSTDLLERGATRDAVLCDPLF